MKKHSWKKIDEFHANVGSFNIFACDACNFEMMIESNDPERVFGKHSGLLLGAQEQPLEDCDEQKIRSILEA